MRRPTSVRRDFRLLFIALFMIILMITQTLEAQTIKKKITSKEIQNAKLVKAKIDPAKLQFNAKLPSKTSIKVWTGQGRPGGEHFNAVPEISISNEREDLNWYFMWETSQPGAKKAIYQFSIFPFNNHDDPLQVSGLLLSDYIEKVPAAGRKELFQVNLKNILPGSNIKLVSTPKPRTNTPLKKNAIKINKSTSLQKKKSASSINATVKPVKGNLQFLRLVPKSKVTLNDFTIYVRVVTLGANNKTIGVPSKQAIIHYGPPKVTPINYYEDPNAPKPPVKINNPCVKILMWEYYRVYQSDWIYRYVVTKDVDILGMKYTKGQKLFLPPKKENDSIWDKVKGAFNSIKDFVESVVNYVSNAYASIKAEALRIAISIAKSTVGCGQECQAAFSFALDYGLAAMGMPPSIPNFDELTNLGKDYLVKTIAEQSGLPESAVASGMNKFSEELSKAASSGGGKGASWLKLDPDYQYRDFIIWLEVWNSTNKMTDPTSVVISQFHPIFYFGKDKKYRSVAVPALKPGERLKIPVLLAPNSMQVTHDMNSLLQSDWNKLVNKGVTIFADITGYGENRPYHDVEIIKK